MIKNKLQIVFYFLWILLLNITTGNASVSESIVQNENNPSSPVIHYFYLHPVQNVLPLELYFRIDEKEVQFMKEPDLGKGRIYRKLLPLGNDEKDYIPFAWNVKTQKLYLDFNRNLDLTDDPDNVFDASEKKKRIQKFTNIPIERQIDIPHEKSPLILRFMDRKPIHTSVYYVDFYLMDFNNLILYLNVNSSWQGEIDLPDIKAQMTITDNLDGRITSPERPKELSSDIYNLESIVLKDLSTSPTSISSDFILALKIPDKIHINTRPYEVQFDFVERFGEILLKVGFRETTPDMGTILLPGIHIKQLIIYGEYKIHLISPGAKVKIPAGEYKTEKSILETTDAKQRFLGFPDINFTLEKNGEYELNLGGPFKSKVEAHLFRGYLKINHELRGIGNNRYYRLDRDASPQFELDQNASQFEIYKGDKKIFSDKFQFG